jgi:hypothetical protein
MILKAQSKDDGWIYIDGIKSLHVKHVQYLDLPMTDVDKPGAAETMPMFLIGEEGGDPDKEEYTQRCFVPSEKHGCIMIGGMYPALELQIEGEGQRNIVIAEGYLLNDNGKTIDKFEPYAGAEVGIVMEGGVVTPDEHH